MTRPHTLNMMVDACTCDLDESSHLTLKDTIARDPALLDELESLELSITALDLAFMLEPESMPDAPIKGSFLDIAQTHQAPSRSPWAIVAFTGWAAAALILMSFFFQGSSATRAPELSPQAARAKLLIAHDDTVTLAWGDWSLEDDAPEIQGVTGDVVWSDEAQKGYMRLVGLPKNDPSDRQYQLWIVDAQRGMSQRISGCVFDATGDNEILVEIDDPRIPVSSAAAFAVTIEEPGGVWVSDMSRRVVIAAR